MQLSKCPMNQSYGSCSVSDEDNLRTTKSTNSIDLLAVALKNYMGLNILMLLRAKPSQSLQKKKKKNFFLSRRRSKKIVCNLNVTESLD